MNDTLTTLASVPFAIAVTALLRKRWPQIDGAYVALVVLVLTVLGAVLGHYHASIPAEVWTAAGPLLAAILALGGVTTAQHVAKPSSPWPGEAPTKKEGK
jgi:disulfide bond formation protein DsbB